jgi:TolB-like protein
MKSNCFVLFAICIVLCNLIARAQDMDTELTKLTEDLAGKIKANGNKKVTVLDFTDLQGGASELGKYIAEQLTVDFVMSKREFAVLDRANLKSILAEHKLTATGLVDPENAKQLGKFAGVDALIIGNIIPIGSNTTLTVKIITTETAEVVGAAKAKSKTDDTVQQFSSQPAQATEVSEPGQPQLSPTRKPFGDLLAQVESINVTPGDGVYGYATLTLTITNTSASLTYGVSANPDFYNKMNLSDSQGNVFRMTEVTGIETAYEGFRGVIGKASEIDPQSAITIIAKSQVRWSGNAGEHPPYRFQTELIFGAMSKGSVIEIRKYNLSLNIK